MLGRLEPVATVSSLIGIAGVLWLGPLMFDQFVFFADQDQTRQAAIAREAMGPAAAIVILASAGLLIRRRPWHALVAVLPAAVAVPLALLAPDASYQVLAYGSTAPAALGALVSVVLPPPRRISVPAMVVGAVLVGLAVLATPFIALVILMAGIAWWRMPKQPPPSAAPSDRR